jgi:5-formyltetrahydrofolate cyclo-ligase
MPKDAIRSRLLEQRRQLTAERHRADSLAVQQQLLLAAEFVAARRIALYSPIQKEVATDLLRSVAFASGKELAYPRVRAEQLEFVAVRPNDELVRGAFGVAEPAGSRLVPLSDIDLLVVPGVAFDRRGHRLGYGKGYYDRALAGGAGRPLTVGLGFVFQQVDLLPNQKHDVQLQLLVTEHGISRFATQDETGG